MISPRELGAAALLLACLAVIVWAPTWFGRAESATVTADPCGHPTLARAWDCEVGR